jgi:hypothetical protein
MTDAGVIFITAIGDADDYGIGTLKLLNEPNEILVVSVERNDFESTVPDLHCEEITDLPEAIDAMADLLTSREIIEEYQI